MAGVSKLGRAIMRSKSLAPVSGSRIKVYRRKVDLMADRSGVAEEIALMAEARGRKWDREGVRLAAGQHNPFPEFAEEIREWERNRGMTLEQADKLIDRWAGDPMVADDEIATAMRLIRARNAELVAALRAIKVGEVYGTPYIGVVSDDGCWSVKIEDASGQRMFREWMKKRDDALADAGHKQGSGE